MEVKVKTYQLDLFAALFLAAYVSVGFLFLANFV